MVYAAKDYNNTTELFNMMQKASGQMGIKVEEPAWCEFGGGYEKEYIKAINDTIDPKNMILAVVVL